MRRTAVTIFIVLMAIASGVTIFWWVKLPRMTPSPPPEPINTNAASFEHRETDEHDQEFTERVVPIFQTFLSTLDEAGVNPLKEQPSFNNVRFLRSPHATICKFLIGDGWAASYIETAKFRGITHFGQAGPDNPFRAISHANTNALARLSQNAIKMPEAEAKRIMNHIANVLRVDRSQFAKPEIYPEKLFDYDLGLWSVRYRKKGTDPINGLNYKLSFSIKATSPTTAVLVSFTQASR